MPEEKYREIGDIRNHYGGLNVKKADGKFFWSIENYDGFEPWKEIPESLYHELIAHDDAMKVARIDPSLQS